MPFPLIAVSTIFSVAGFTTRIAAIGTFLTGLVASFVGFLATWVTKKVAINLVIVGLIVGLTVAVFTSIKVLIDGVVLVAPTYLVEAMNFITPDNFWPCVSALFSAKLIRWVWAWKVHFIEMYSSGT